MINNYCQALSTKKIDGTAKNNEAFNLFMLDLIGEPISDSYDDSLLNCDYYLEIAFNHTNSAFLLQEDEILNLTLSQRKLINLSFNKKNKELQSSPAFLKKNENALGYSFLYKSYFVGFFKKITRQHPIILNAYPKYKLTKHNTLSKLTSITLICSLFFMLLFMTIYPSFNSWHLYGTTNSNLNFTEKIKFSVDAIHAFGLNSYNEFNNPKIYTENIKLTKTQLANLNKSRHGDYISLVHFKSLQSKKLNK